MAEHVVLVTGGGRGIGRAVCQRFAGAGSIVTAVARTASELDETRSIVEQAGGRCLVQVGDVGTEQDVQRVVAGVRDRLGQVDVLVNCAGVAPLAAIEDLTPELFDEIWRVNARATYLTCRAAWPIMRTQGGGVIVNISSVASIDPFPGFAAYGAAKAWVNVWTKALAEEGRAVGIRVFAVAPGAVETQMLRGPFPEFPKKDTLEPGDVADVVHSLAQPACRYATGQTVFVRKQGD